MWEIKGVYHWPTIPNLTMHVKITKSTDRPHLKRKIKPEHMEIKQKDITWQEIF